MSKPSRAVALVAFVLCSGSSVAFADAPSPTNVDQAVVASTFCALERSIGVAETDALAIEDIVCAPVRANRTSYPGDYRIRIAKIGAKVVLTLVSRPPGGAATEKQIVMTSLEEVTVAAPRLLEAAVEEKSVDATVDVTNVVGDEARVPKKRPSSVHAWFGVIGAGDGNGMGGGVALGISAGAERWSFIADLRLAGEAFNRPAALAAAISTLGTVVIEPEATFSYASLAGGARHHFSASDVAPFVGAGLALDYVGRPTIVTKAGCCGPGSTHREREAFGTTGLAAYAEVGLDVLRTRAVGGAIVLRADAPAFMTTTEASSPTDPSTTVKTSTWGPVMSAGIMLRF